VNTLLDSVRYREGFYRTERGIHAFLFGSIPISLSLLQPNGDFEKVVHR
jgi:hypothetical protein